MRMSKLTRGLRNWIKSFFFFHFFNVSFNSQNIGLKKLSVQKVYKIPRKRENFFNTFPCGPLPEPAPTHRNRNRDFDMLEHIRIFSCSDNWLTPGQPAKSGASSQATRARAPPVMANLDGWRCEKKPSAETVPLGSLTRGAKNPI